MSEAPPKHVVRFAALRRVAGHLRRALFYRDYDAEAYWRARAAQPGQASVLWRNETYNRCYRERQRDILAELSATLPDDARVLDVGCGVGVVAEMLVELHPTLSVDAVDYPEMIAVARRERDHLRITWHEGSAEGWSPRGARFDMVLSSACYSAIRDLPAMWRAIDTGAVMVAPGGRMVMMDPFHRWAYLARARVSSGEIARRLTGRGFVLERRSGVLFWPFREWLANADLPADTVERRFALGERLLRLLGPHAWGDYKILVFRRTDDAGSQRHE